MSDYQQLIASEQATRSNRATYCLPLAVILTLASLVALLVANVSPSSTRVSTQLNSIRGAFSNQFQCSCPPSEAIWSCTEAEYRALMANPNCVHTELGAVHACSGCSGGDISMECRACANSLSAKDFCKACASLGLNDIGCNQCSRGTVLDTVLVGGDADKHGCRPSAGYQWCPAKSSCVRPWELGIHSLKQFDATCATPDFAQTMQRSGGHLCSCPPSEAIWACTEKEHKELESNRNCMHDRTSNNITGSLLLSGSPPKKSGVFFCTCPPSDAIWACTAEEHNKLLKSSDCRHDKTTSSAMMFSLLDSSLAQISNAHTCSCPPSDAIWPCNSQEYEKLMKNPACIREKPSDPIAFSICGACSHHEQSLACRSCRTGMTPEKFCEACISLGLNDVGCHECKSSVAAIQPIGGDVDKHGCRPSAGYQWCEAKASCVRPWEEGSECSNEKPSQIFLAGNDADEHGCRPSAGYQWCEAQSMCVRPWELGIHTLEALAARCAVPAADRQGALRSQV